MVYTRNLLILLLLLICGATHGQTWVPLGSEGFSAGEVDFTSIAIDGSGTPYVVFEDASVIGRFRATVMKYNGSKWTTVGVPGFSVSDVGYATISIDPGGTPYVAYVDYGNGQKSTVMKFDGANWVNVGIAGFSAGNIYSISMAIDRSGTPYVVYSDGVSSQKATVMKYSGGNWVTVGSAGFSDSAVYSPTIAVDTGGTPYIVYEDVGNGSKATVKKYDGTNWVTVGSKGFSSGLVEFTSIAIDGSNRPYVAFLDNSNGNKATVMQFNGSNWVIVGTAGFSVGEADWINLAINHAGTPYVAYSDQGITRSAVKKFDGTYWVDAGTPQVSDTLATNTSIAVDRNGTPYVVYTDFSSKSYGRATVMILDSNISAITGANTLCVGDTTTLNNATAAGTWSSSNTSVATVSSGIVAGLSVGVITISYMVPGGVATFTVNVEECPNGVKSIGNPSPALAIFPNPGYNTFTVNLPSPVSENAYVVVTNVLGEQIKAFYITTNKEIDVRLDAPPGVYFVTAVTSAGKQSAKVVVR